MLGKVTRMHNKQSTEICTVQYKYRYNYTYVCLANVLNQGDITVRKNSTHKRVYSGSE